jgi:LysR family transcriptional regulator for bpeEF and oprC
MDKLRSLEYFVAAAEERSFSGAARRLGVTAPAVSKLITSLERSLGTPLFERHAQGLQLSTGGTAYLEACRPALCALADADEQASAVGTRVRGTVVVALQPVIAQEWLARALPRFNALYPEVQLDIRYAMQTTDPNARGADVFLLLGWQEAADLVQRHLGGASLVVCATPAYWALHGLPEHPRDLEHHNCLNLRVNSGTLMDLWNFKRGDERVSVTARGWLVTDNAHRDTLVEMGRAGAGVMRVLDWPSRRRDFAAGALTPALTDWEAIEVPPVNVLYPPSVRRVPRVRAFIDFVAQVYRDVAREREQRAASTGKPQWLKSRPPRASSTIARGR